MHGKHVDPAGRGDMGGGSVRAGRGAARSWERQRRTGTGLAVTALAVLRTLLVIRESRSSDVAFGKASTAEPDATDTGAGQCERAIHPVGGDTNRHASSEWSRTTHNCPTGICVEDDRLRTQCRSRQAPSVNEASGSDGAAQGVGGTHADTGTLNVTGDMTGEGAESEGLRGSSQLPHKVYEGTWVLRRK